MLRAGLANALAELGKAMRRAEDPWWLIGSAAMALHGADVSVADIDLMVSVDDADRLFGGCVGRGRQSDLFRPERHGAWMASGMVVDVMARLEVRSNDRWVAVAPPAREALRLGDIDLFTPGAAGPLALCRLFGRPEDRQRAALLEALV